MRRQTLCFTVLIHDGNYIQVPNSNIVGNTVTLGTALNALSEARKAPAAGAPFNIGYSDINLTQWRVLTVEEGEGVYSVTAAAHERNKYDIIEGFKLYVWRSHCFAAWRETRPGYKPAARRSPSMKRATRFCTESINWQQSVRANEYEVEYRFDADNSTTVLLQAPALTSLILQVGSVLRSVRAVGYDLDVERTGKRFSSATTATINAVGKSSPPSNIASLNITPIDQHTAELHWPEATDLDVRIGGTIEIRHNPRHHWRH